MSVSSFNQGFGGVVNKRRRDNDRIVILIFNLNNLPG
jgi:hypothetical protein